MKRFFWLLLVAALVLSMNAATYAATAAPRAGGYGYACPGAGFHGFMYDESGALLDKEAFEKRLDKAIEDGTILAEDKEYYLEMYDYCSAYGGQYGCGRRLAGKARGNNAGRGAGGCCRR